LVKIGDITKEGMEIIERMMGERNMREEDILMIMSKRRMRRSKSI